MAARIPRHPQPAGPAEQSPPRAHPRADRQIPVRALIASSPFGAALSSLQVAGAIAQGLVGAGAPAPDQCAFAAAIEEPREVGRLLRAAMLAERVAQARCVILAAAGMSERTLAGSMVFEIATIARQGGVPAYAVTAENGLGAFDARILDLQLIIEARGARSLRSAGAKLAGLI